MNSKKLNILLLNVISISFFYDQVVITYWLVSMASYIKSEDYDIRGIDMNSPPERILNKYSRIYKELLKEILKKVY